MPRKNSVSISRLKAARIPWSLIKGAKGEIPPRPLLSKNENRDGGPYTTIQCDGAPWLRRAPLVDHRGCLIREQSAVDVSGIIQEKLFENRYVILAFRLVLGLTFLVSSFGKLVDIEHYSVAMVYNFDILPGPLAIGFGWALPFIELACAIGLLLGVLTRLSALGIGLLSVSFFVTKVILLSRGTDVECGCFGAIGSTMASWSIYLDPAILLLSMTLLFSSRQSRHWVSLGRKLPSK